MSARPLSHGSRRASSPTGGAKTDPSCHREEGQSPDAAIRNSLVPLAAPLGGGAPAGGGEGRPPMAYAPTMVPLIRPFGAPSPQGGEG